MAHEHHHHHAASLEQQSLNKSFIVGILLNSVFVVVEFIVGFSYNSLSLLSDAGHNLGDVMTLILALLAFRLNKVKRLANYTYGLQKSSILIALVNAVLLLFVVVEIVYEALIRISSNPSTQGKTIALVAFVGILVNGISALLFVKNKEKDINVKGAYLHMATDALVSLSVVVGGLLIFYTHWYWVDSALSILVAIVILISTWNLLKDSIRLSLDGVPNNLDLEQLKKASLKVKGVKNIHHIHAWAISTSQNAVTAHIVLDDFQHLETIKSELKHTWEHFNVQHSTIEFEIELCEENTC